jgi:hypothetical protein
MTDSDFNPHETDDFTEDCDCEVGASCITQPPKRNDFVLPKLATKETVKCFVGLIQEMGLDSCKIKFLRR